MKLSDRNGSRLLVKFNEKICSLHRLVLTYSDARNNSDHHKTPSTYQRLVLTCRLILNDKIASVNCHGRQDETGSLDRNLGDQKTVFIFLTRAEIKVKRYRNASLRET